MRGKWVGNEYCRQELTSAQKFCLLCTVTMNKKDGAGTI